MNSLDRKLELFARQEPADADVQDAQRKLEARVAAASRKHVRPRVAGWMAAATSALAAVVAFIWLPVAPSTALAFSSVQKHFSDFRTLRFEIEQRVQGNVVMTSRVSMLADGSVRTEVGDVVVIVNSTEKQVLTLLKVGHTAVVTPLDMAPTKDDSLAWLQEIRDFQGSARALPETRRIGGETAWGWELPMEQGKIVLWANAEGLPLEMQIDRGMKIDLSFRFDFDPELPAILFSTKVPDGYALQPSGGD